MMTDAQYIRIETAAGGVGCGNRAFLRECRAYLSPMGKSREFRELRHEWLRDGLRKLNDMGALYDDIMGDNACAGRLLNS